MEFIFKKGQVFYRDIEVELKDMKEKEGWLPFQKSIILCIIFLFHDIVPSSLPASNCRMGIGNLVAQVSDTPKTYKVSIVGGAGKIAEVRNVSSLHF
tara:strand:- start:839 stop:1129 length:291 start_codon:yes stop_codon:yes gene_type:complete